MTLRLLIVMIFVLWSCQQKLSNSRVQEIQYDTFGNIISTSEASSPYKLIKKAEEALTPDVVAFGKITNIAVSSFGPSFDPGLPNGIVTLTYEYPDGASLKNLSAIYTAASKAGELSKVEILLPMTLLGGLGVGQSQLSDFSTNITTMVFDYRHLGNINFVAGVAPQIKRQQDAININADPLVINILQ